MIKDCKVRIAMKEKVKGEKHNIMLSFIKKTILFTIVSLIATIK
jgi:hypothetical protein